MKTLPILLVLLCAACATSEQVSKDETYKAPVYRTGSNLPAGREGSRAPDATSVDGNALRQALPPQITPKPTNG